MDIAAKTERNVGAEVRQKLGLLMACASLLLTAAPAGAASSASLQAVHKDWMAPRAQAFQAASASLTQALERYCAGPTTNAPTQSEVQLDSPRQAWREALGRWERLSAVAIGPVLEQRIQRRIDFIPTRPRMIQKAIKGAPANAQDMELIGTPAKGFPALEWLLWTQPIQPATPGCGYAVQVAREIDMEAQAMVAGYQQAADRVLNEEAAKTALSELVNQWVGGLERLRWANMEMPVRVAGTAGPEAVPEYMRQASGVAAESWAAQWDLLRTLAAGEGAGTLQAMLKAQGNEQVATALSQAVADVQSGMTELAATDKARILNTTKAMSALKALVENEVAPALGVSIGFSDADGD